MKKRSLVWLIAVIFFWNFIISTVNVYAENYEVFFASLFCIKLQKVFVGCCTYIL